VFYLGNSPKTLSCFDFRKFLSVSYHFNPHRITPRQSQLLHPESILEPQNVTVMKKAKITRATIKVEDYQIFDWED